MINKKNITLAIALACLSFTVHAKTVKINVVNPNNPPALADYRLDYSEMRDIADGKKLSHRVFYTPSIGPDAAWFDAVKKGDLETVKKMHKKGQNLEAKDSASLDQTALGWAAFIGYEDMVHYLVESGANLNATDKADVWNALKSAGLGKNVEVFKYLQTKIKDIDLDDRSHDNEDESFLMIAASNNRIELVKYLLEQGVKVNPVSKVIDQSALSYACSRGHQELADILIKAGAINHKTKKPKC